MPIYIAAFTSKNRNAYFILYPKDLQSFERFFILPWSTPGWKKRDQIASISIPSGPAQTIPLTRAQNGSKTHQNSLSTFPTNGLPRWSPYSLQHLWCNSITVAIPLVFLPYITHHVQSLLIFTQIRSTPTSSLLTEGPFLKFGTA